MKIIRSFELGERYRKDFDLCSCARGWAQVTQDQKTILAQTMRFRYLQSGYSGQASVTPASM